MRPVGLEVPDSGKRAYAVVQLRQEDREGRIYGLVGCQTRLTWGEQDRVFRLIPGLKNADFVRYGVMHRNTFINSPELLLPTLQSKNNPLIFWAGQVTGVEGYMESAATGILAAINAARYINKKELLILSTVTMLGSLVNFITSSVTGDLQPVNCNFGILPPLENEIKDKKKRYQAYVNRSINAITELSDSLL
jgi:methylenetetrahydrofolate--tRNA-(uracil-5-)-methyltransferase